MITDETRPEEFINPGPSNHSDIKGWGMDADTENDPTYPMKTRTDEEQRGYTWERPQQQNSEVEVLHSVERKNTPAVFGTSEPPKGLSGTIRRQAFKYSESSYGRWLPLVLADRLGVFEGLLEDIGKGHIPDLWKELGLAAEWKYNKKNFLFKAAAVAVTATLVIGLVTAATKKRRA